LNRQRINVRLEKGAFPQKVALSATMQASRSSKSLPRIG